MCGDAGRALGSPFSSPLDVFVPLACSCCTGSVEVCIKLWVMNRLLHSCGALLCVFREEIIALVPCALELWVWGRGTVWIQRCELGKVRDENCIFQCGCFAQGVSDG